MNDPIQAGMLKAAVEDYLRHCAEIDRGVDGLTDRGLKGAFEALLQGDTVERDRLCSAAERLPSAAAAAKLEIGLRIAERVGLDRDELMAAVERLRLTQ